MLRTLNMPSWVPVLVIVIGPLLLVALIVGMVITTWPKKKT